ncbi:FadR family transcriptional regulator [Nocardioides marmoriginsengisoli]|uniref:FadR family transcriptional regulator n=1 Tax=Nocardioides marmoriginsengisoli TaxID=661483 RepID=A0A3N0CCB4_9ACTN|nr:GntR family transcriptional regulator [Nocardioides marmoriginsengisoli]RNL61088.1 FadR family transcriptional regulator [Nocardioides marmoriginsengisoli]
MTDVSAIVPGTGVIGTPMRAPKTAELIAGHLRRQIVRGELKAGETIPPEQQLMEQYGVSRPTLREAYRILEAESLIGVRRGARGGAQVLEPDPMVAARHVALLLQLQGTTIQDVYEARLVGEPACARLLATRRNAQDLADLRAVAEHLGHLLEAKSDTPDMSQWSSTTYRFHELIMQRCGNKTLAVQGAVLADIVAVHLSQAITTGMSREVDAQPARFRKTLRSYEKLIRLVEEKDADGAETHWRSHMEVAAKYIFRFDPGNKPLVDLFS